MKPNTAVSKAPLHGATIHALRLVAEAAAQPAHPADKIALEDLGEVLAGAMGTLMRLHLGEPGRAARGLASSTELARMIDAFLTIRDAERRGHCLATLCDCAAADAAERASTG